jgi:hypothetical protein
VANESVLELRVHQRITMPTLSGFNDPVGPRRVPSSHREMILKRELKKGLVKYLHNGWW